MYNFFVTAEIGAWDRDFYEYDRSRFLEYTDDKISARFEPLNEERIEALLALPCLFAYEGSDKAVRVGRLISIKERARKILVEFVLDSDIPGIPFSSIQPIAPLLDIRDWEMNRTHWAVKDEDLFKRLGSAKLIPAGIAGKKIGGRTTTSTGKSPRASSRITTVTGFIGKVLEEREKKTRAVFYRGHSDQSKYKLEPSLFRTDVKGNYLYLDKEHILYRELIVSNSADFSSDEYTLDKLVRMQHYSLPTRLLDITSNPLIALYFACKSNVEEEGEVIVFALKEDQIKYFDSDTASCLANLARLPKEEKRKIDFDLDLVDFNKQKPIERLIHLIKEEKSFFEPRIQPEDLQSIICVKGKKSNDRISFQSGAFLLFGLDSVLDERGTRDIEVKRIAVGNKTEILRELDLLNINESTVFPYIENSAKYVAEKYKFEPVRTSGVS